MNSLFQSGHWFSLIRNPHHFVAAVLGMGLGSAHGEISFMKEIAPVVQRRCVGCHGEKKSSGNYRLHTFKYLSQAIVPNQPDESEFYLLLIEPEQEDRMPKEDDALSDQQIQTIRQWIKEGAHFDGVSPDDSFQAQAFPRDHPPAPEQYRLPIPVTALAFSPTGIRSMLPERKVSSRH